MSGVVRTLWRRLPSEVEKQLGCIDSFARAGIISLKGILKISCQAGLTNISHFCLPHSCRDGNCELGGHLIFSRFDGTLKCHYSDMRTTMHDSQCARRWSTGNAVLLNLKYQIKKRREVKRPTETPPPPPGQQQQHDIQFFVFFEKKKPRKGKKKTRNNRPPPHSTAQTPPVNPW